MLTRIILYLKRFFQKNPIILHVDFNPLSVKIGDILLDLQSIESYVTQVTFLHVIMNGHYEQETLVYLSNSDVSKHWLIDCQAVSIPPYQGKMYLYEKSDSFIISDDFRDYLQQSFFSIDDIEYKKDYQVRMNATNSNVPYDLYMYYREDELKNKEFMMIIVKDMGVEIYKNGREFAENEISILPVEAKA